MRKLLTLMVAGFLGSACAFTDVPLTLPTNALENTIGGGGARQVVVVIPFRDERAIRGRCGMKKNGYNMDTADAICQSDPNAWFATLLANELRAAGFRVLSESQDHKREALIVEGELLKIFVEPVIGFWTGSLEADLSFQLKASSETGLAAQRTFFVKGWKGGQLVATNQPYQTALHRATQAVLAEMVRAIVELMDRYPQLGLRDAPLRVALFSERSSQ